MARTKGKIVIDYKAKKNEYEKRKKELWKKYKIRIESEMGSLKKHMEEMKVMEPSTMNKVLYNMYEVSKLIFHEVQKVEAKLKKDLIENRGAVKIEWCKSEDDINVDGFYTRNEEGKSMFEGYKGEECIIITNYEPGLGTIDLNELTNKRLVSVDNGERQILFTSKVIKVVRKEEEEDEFPVPMKAVSLKETIKDN